MPIGSADSDRNPGGATDGGRPRSLRGVRSSTARAGSSTEFRDDEALDYFELASGRSTDAEVRASAAAFVAGILLSSHRPWEVEAWADIVRENSPRPDLGDFLEAAGRLQLDDPEGAREGARTRRGPDRPVVPLLGHGRAHRARPTSRTSRATSTRPGPRCSPPSRPTRSRPRCGTRSRACAPTPTSTRPRSWHRRARRPHLRSDHRAPELRARGRRPHRRADLGAQPGRRARARARARGSRRSSRASRAMEWSARMRGIGMGRTCPLLARAEDERGRRDRAGPRLRARCTPRSVTAARA